MASIRVSADSASVSFPAVTVTNPLVVSYFDQIPDSNRMQIYERALAIGVMALRDERIAAFLAKTEDALGVQLEWLKVLFEKQQLRLTSAPVKGESGELAVANALVAFTEARKLGDQVAVVGRTAGRLPKNKTGDILCTVGDGDDAPTIVVEVKLDRSVRLGDPSMDGLTAGKSDSAWSQLVEAKSNRDADMAIMVFSSDSVDRSIGNFTDSVRYIDGIGYLVVVDVARGDYRPLSIAYELARQQVLRGRRDGVDPEVMNVLMRRLVADLGSALQIQDSINGAIQHCNNALRQVEASLAAVGATQKAMQQYHRDGRLDSMALLALLVPHKAPAIAMAESKGA